MATDACKPGQFFLTCPVIPQLKHVGGGLLVSPLPTSDCPGVALPPPRPRKPEPGLDAQKLCVVLLLDICSAGISPFSTANTFLCPVFLAVRIATSDSRARSTASAILRHLFKISLSRVCCDLIPCMNCCLAKSSCPSSGILGKARDVRMRISLAKLSRLSSGY